MSSPTHFCSKCMDFYDVERDPKIPEIWYVTAHDAGWRLSAKVWSETAQVPICPRDGTTLTEFLIELDGKPA